MFVGVWEASLVGSSWSATFVSCGLLRAVKPREFDWWMNHKQVSRQDARSAWAESHSADYYPSHSQSQLKSWDTRIDSQYEIFFIEPDWEAVDAGAWFLCTEPLAQSIAIAQCYTGHMPLMQGCFAMNSLFCTIWPHVGDQMFPGRSQDTLKLYIRAHQEQDYFWLIWTSMIHESKACKVMSRRIHSSLLLLTTFSSAHSFDSTAHCPYGSVSLFQQKGSSRKLISVFR